MLNKTRLDYFQATVQAGSIRTAAKRLNIAASAISRQISLIEDELGGLVLERLQNGVQPTELGLLLLKHCQKISALDLSFKQEISNYHKLAAGQLNICVGEGFINAIVNNPLKQFSEKFQGIDLNIDTGSTAQIITNLLHDNAHIGVMYQGDAHHDLHYWYTQTQPLQALVSARHALASKQGPISLATIAQQKLILWREGHGVRQLVNQGFIQAGITPISVLESNSLAAIRHMVLLGTGITLLPACAAEIELASGAMVAKPINVEIFSQAKTHVVTRVGRNLPRSGLQLLRYLGHWLQNSNQYLSH